jgi:hypothetical protein
VLDVCRRRTAPFDPQEVVKEYAALLKRYGCRRVIGDRYSGEWVISAYRDRGISYEVSERTASDIYLEALPAFATGSIDLLDHKHLLNELRQLERRTGRGRDIVTHPPRLHDDCAVAACGALLLAVAAVPLDLEHQAFLSPCTVLQEMRDEHPGHMGDLGDFDNDSPLFSEKGEKPW